MSWCPECKAEYMPEFDTCADCGCALVDEMPQNAEPYAHPAERGGWRRYTGALVFAVVMCAAFIACLPVFATTGTVEPSGVSLILACLCLAGFALGNYTKFSIGKLMLGWLISSLVLWPITVREEAGYATLSFGYILIWLLVVCAVTLFISLPVMVSAYLACGSPRKGRLYLIVWVFFTIILVCIPYALRFYAQAQR